MNIPQKWYTPLKVLTPQQDSGEYRYYLQINVTKVPSEKLPAQVYKANKEE